MSGTDTAYRTDLAAQLAAIREEAGRRIRAVERRTGHPRRGASTDELVAHVESTAAWLEATDDLGFRHGRLGDWATQP